MMKVTAADLWVTAQTIWGESRGEPIAGQYAVAHVIFNRSIHRDLSPLKVCLQKWQFSVWNDNDPNKPKLEALTIEDNSFYKCFEIALKVLGKKHVDTTEGSMHYHHKCVNPYWAKGHIPVKRIGAHLFYNDVR